MEIKGTGNQEIRKSVDEENREFRNEDFRSFDSSAGLRAGFLSLRAGSTRAQAETPDQIEGKLAGAGIGLSLCQRRLKDINPYYRGEG